MEGGNREEAGPSSFTSVVVLGSDGGFAEERKNEDVNLNVEDFEALSVGRDSDDDEGDDNEVGGGGGGGQIIGTFVPGPLLSLKDQIDKDKEDESLRRWKEKLLGCFESELDGQMEPEVNFHSIGIISPDFGEITTSLPVNEGQTRKVHFTLKEGSEYLLKLTFSVHHNIVSGLAYTNTVWRNGFQVDRNKGMLGTFAPQQEPYVYTLEQDTTPSGVLARGTYTAKLRFEDDDKRCHMELNYSFEIKKSR